MRVPAIVFGVLLSAYCVRAANLLANPEFEVPAAACYLVFSCNTDKANRSTVWFDNLLLEPVATATAPPPAPPADGTVEALVPIDTFENPGIAWRPNAWGTSTPARLTLLGEALPSAPASCAWTAPRPSCGPAWRT